jgi:uncharacterized protein YpmS
MTFIKIYCFSSKISIQFIPTIANDSDISVDVEHFDFISSGKTIYKYIQDIHCRLSK